MLSSSQVLIFEVDNYALIQSGFNILMWIIMLSPIQVAIIIPKK